jgi:hypothetical protein
VTVEVSRSLLLHLPELVELQRLSAHAAKDFIRVRELVSVKHKDLSLPVLAFEMGSLDPKAPAFFLTGGVHGLERIGTRVIISYLKTLTHLAHWDASTRDLLGRVRFCILPIINPVGMYLGRRSNGNGVDLMRNAPIEADSGSRVGIAGGHRISPRLPWYRGAANSDMEAENVALVRYFEETFSTSKAVIGLDVHSGFGAVDRIWFPYARTAQPFPNLHEVFLLTQMLDKVYPHHIYRVEPQATSYTTHGDVWDYLYDRRRDRGGSIFLPLTLELGSWLWIKKNPRQLFSGLGIFNPLLPHRTSRILRRHLLLLDFLMRASAMPDMWCQGLGTHFSSEDVQRLAKARWYDRSAA